MATLKLIQFSGEIPRLIPRLLPDTAAQRAENVRLDDGGLTPIRKPRLDHVVAGVSPIETIYKHGSEWLAWDTVVHAAPGPVAQDRLYYTGDGVPKMRVGTTIYPLAMNPPTVALTAALGGAGSGDIITRLYVYTEVTDFGEESEPCPISNEVNWQPGNTVTLSGFRTPPAGRNITKQRIYRSQSSVLSGTDLFLIAERAASNANYVDNIGVDDFAEALPSRDWNPPPDTLQGLIALQNGMMAAFVGKDLYFCEPYRPHAWPENYVLTLDYPIVALGAFGTTLVVMTTGQPYIVTGTAPENMQQERLELNLPCINARGVVDLGYSVAYPSHDGLVVVNSGGASVATGQLMTRNDWLKTSPATFVASQFSGRYFASYEYLEADGTSSTGTFIFDLAGGTPFVMRSSLKADACFYDVPASALYMLFGTEIYEFDALGQVNEIMTWHSKQFVLPAPSTFGAILIEGAEELTAEEQKAIADQIAEIEAENAAIFAQASIGGELNGGALNVYPVNGDQLLPMPEETFISVRVYADGKLLATISEINKVKRIPPAKARNWEVQVNGTTPIGQISMATAARELNGI
ncbi:MAG TPA: hypothetical protein VFW49_14780 [Fluviicoccus sp.]|nr:hypothetical protein [Fluviicoccus sp.]